MSNTNFSALENLRKKICLAFPMEKELEINICEQIDSDKIEYSATSNLFGTNIKSSNMYTSKEEAESNLLKDIDTLIEGIYKMVCFKHKFNKQKRGKDSVKVCDKSNVSFNFTPQKVQTKTEKRKSETKDKPSKSKRVTKQVKEPPMFVESKKETKNNILYSICNIVKDPGAYIESYCKQKMVPFPEYLFEKSNGVYLCRGTFLNEKFESRYAYEMETAKQEVSNLIVSYLKHTTIVDNDFEIENMFKDIVERKPIEMENKIVIEEPADEIEMDDNLSDEDIEVTEIEIEDIVSSLSTIHKNDFD